MKNLQNRFSNFLKKVKENEDFYNRIKEKEKLNKENLNQCKNKPKGFWFEKLIFIVIIISSIVIGFETDYNLFQKYHTFFHYFELFIILFFSAEIVIKLMSHSPQPFNYFKSGWNIFDFVIVVSSIIPFLLQSDDYSANAILILRFFRLARVFRVVRVITHLKPLRDLVETLIKSIPSMGYVTILLGVLFYIYSVIGVIIFSENDPLHFGNLQKTALTLFQTLTGENWPDLLKIQMLGSDKYYIDGLEDIQRNPNAFPVFSVVYFVSFILIGAMIVLNLFIGIIVNKMEMVTCNDNNEDAETKESLIMKIEEKNKEIDELLSKLKKL